MERTSAWWRDRSIKEEILSMIKLCAGLLAYIADIRWLAVVLWVFAFVDYVCCMIAHSKALAENQTKGA
jgi:hypothetical protein